MDALPPDDEPAPGLEGDPSPGPDELPVARPGAAQRAIRIAITLVLIASLVVVFGLNLNGGRGQATVPSVDTLHPASEPPIAQRLAVIDANGGLSLIDVDSGSVVRYPAPGLTFQLPAWSPDGTRIASIGSGVLGTSLDVFGPAINGAAAAPAVVYQSLDHPAFYLYWAPDGKALGFLTTELDGIALRRIAADGSGVDTTIRQGAPMYWQWLDATRLLVHSGGSADEGFAGVVGLNGAPTEARTIAAGSYRAPAMSADGSHVGYAISGQEGSTKVVVESLDGAAHGEITVFSAAAFEFDPAGHTLAFTAADKAGGAPDFPVGPLREIDPATGIVRTLLEGSVVAFFWAPDGRTIAALRVPGPGDTTVTSADAPTGVAIRAGTPAAAARAAETAAQTAAGIELQIIFVDVPSGAIRSARVGRVSDLFISQVVPYFDQYALSHRFWSPDSASIVLPIDDDQGVSQLEIIPADGSDARVIVSGLIATWSP